MVSVLLTRGSSSFLARNGMKQLTTAHYHPSSNWLAKRSVQVKRGQKKNVSGSLNSRLTRTLLSYCTTHIQLRQSLQQKYAQPRDQEFIWILWSQIFKNVTIFVNFVMKSWRIKLNRGNVWRHNKLAFRSQCGTPNVIMQYYSLRSVIAGTNMFKVSNIHLNPWPTIYSIPCIFCNISLQLHQGDLGSQTHWDCLPQYTSQVTRQVQAAIAGYHMLVFLLCPVRELLPLSSP